jgi:hypothetical protein
VKARLRPLFVAAAILVASTPAARAALDEVEMTNAEMQSLACLGTGTVTASTATVMVLFSPLEALTLPVIAAAFAAGCGVGAVAAPGIHWIARRLGLHDIAPRIVPEASR